MFDWFLPIGYTTAAAAFSEPDAIDLLKNEHDSVKELFDRFKKAGDRRSKMRIAREALRELKILGVLEEEIFYPAVRQSVGKEIMNEAGEEHHVAKVLIAELEAMDGRGDRYDAKFNVLAEAVRHHIKEEQNEMMPKAQAADLDLGKLGEEMLRRKRQLIGSPVKAVRKKPTRARKLARA